MPKDSTDKKRDDLAARLAALSPDDLAKFEAAMSGVVEVHHGVPESSTSSSSSSPKNLVEAKGKPSAGTAGDEAKEKKKNKRRGQVKGKAGEVATFSGDAPAAKPKFSEEDVREVAEKLGIYWVDGAGDKYLVKDRDVYMTVSERKLLKLMKQIPGREWISEKRDTDNEPLAETERVLLHAMIDRRVMAEFPAMAGHAAGYHNLPGGACIVKAGPRVVQPVEGDCGIIRELVEKRLGDVQSPYFHGWLRHAYRSLLEGSPGNFDQGHAIILAGRAKSAKSFLQHFLITPMLGGRSADPESYLFGRTDFNSEMIGAEHLLMEDPANTTLSKDRVYFGEMIKRIVANQTARFHRKSIDGIMGCPFWRLSISVNDDPDKMRVLPLMTPDIQDKLMLFSVASEPMPMPTRSPAEKKLFRDTLVEQLPHYAWWLLNEFELPEELEEVEPRFGLKEHHNLELMTNLFEDTPSSELMTLLDAVVFTTEEGQTFKLWDLPTDEGDENTSDQGPNIWMGSALVLQQLLVGDFGRIGKEKPKYESTVEKEARKLFGFTKSDRLLSRLKEDQPERFDQFRWSKGEHKGRRGWRIGIR